MLTIWVLVQEDKQKITLRILLIKCIPWGPKPQMQKKKRAALSALVLKLFLREIPGHEN